METKGRLVLPNLEGSDEEILDFVKRYFNDDSTYRCRQMERMARNINYYLGRQWIQLDTEAIHDGVRGYKFRDTPQPEGINLPRPVMNRIAPTVEVELATLGKRELTPNVISTSNDPRMIAAAKVAKEILQHRMDVLNWNDLREMVTFLTIVCGTGVFKSYWDETYSDTTFVGSPDAVRCPTCPTVLSSRTVEKSMLPDLKNTESAYGETSETVQLNNCPTCDVPIPLIPAQLDEQQARKPDALGRPLGMDVPKGNTSMEVVSPFDIFPENGGIDVGPKNFKLIGQATVRSLDWVEERYPHIIQDVGPDPAQELLDKHPVLGEWTYMGRYQEALDSGIYENHVRVFEAYHEKCYRFPEGRRVVVVGDKSRVIAENDILYHTNADGVAAPRVSYSIANFKPGRHKEFWGQALVDDLVSPQNRINGLDAQVVEARERLGSPNIIVTEDMYLNGPEWISDYGLGKVMHFTPSAMYPQAKPEIFGGTVMPTQVYEERDRIISDMKDIAGPQDVEIGEAPKNISTTSGLKLLGESAERRRAVRERALVSMYEDVWQHQLKLVWCLREEMDEYEKQIPDGTWEVEQYDRMAVAGQTKVKVEKQAFIDKSIYQKEAAREALADGLIVIDGQATKRKLLELMDLPTEINEDLNRQVDIGKKQWTNFVDKNIVPVIDMGLDDFRIRFQTLGTFLLSDEGQRIEESVKWPEILKKIAGWQEDLARAEEIDAMAVAYYGTRDPQQAAPIYDQAMMQYEQDQVEFEQAMVSSEQMAMSGLTPPAIPPPQAPPQPVFLPAAKEDRIYILWRDMISKADATQAMQVQAQGGDPTMVGPFEPNQDLFLKFRAVVDAYRLLAEAKEMAMTMGMSSMAGSPGTPEGSPGVGGALPGVQQINFPGAPQPNNPTNVPGGRNKNITQGF